jgi:hypothetical protein
MRTFLSLLALGILAVSSVAKAEEYDAIEESMTDADMTVTHSPDMLLRLKSGVMFPAENGEVSHLMPVTLDWSYLGFDGFALGAEISWASGSHSVDRFDMDTLQSAGFSAHRTMANVLATADYKFQLGTARVFAGAKLGAVFYRQSYTLYAGPVSVRTPKDDTKTVFTAGPSLNIDMPVKGPFFVNLGGDYLLSENATQSGSLYAGLGADF